MQRLSGDAPISAIVENRPIPFHCATTRTHSTARAWMNHVPLDRGIGPAQWGPAAVFLPEHHQTVLGPKSPALEAEEIDAGSDRTAPRVGAIPGA